MSQPINPYAAPQVPEAPPPPPTTDKPLQWRPYVSARGKATFATGATAIQLILQVIMVGSFFAQLSLLQGGLVGGGIDQAAADANDRRQLMLAVLLIIAALVSLITLLVWIYAAHANLPALGARDLEFTPGWSVGWFFIPIMNLFKPYQAVREIWQNSDPGPLLHGAFASTALVGWWWGLRICSAITERIASAGGRQADSIEGLIGLSWFVIIVAILLDIPMVVAQILLIRKIQRFQDERYGLMGAAPPPGFAGFGERPFGAT
jgi:uncharacterized protein DUF4328